MDDEIWQGPASKEEEIDPSWELDKQVWGLSDRQRKAQVCSHIQYRCPRALTTTLPWCHRAKAAVHDDYSLILQLIVCNCFFLEIQADVMFTTHIYSKHHSFAMLKKILAKTFSSRLCRPRLFQCRSAGVSFDSVSLELFLSASLSHISSSLSAVNILSVLFSRRPLLFVLTHPLHPLTFPSSVTPALSLLPNCIKKNLVKWCAPDV